jgi:hypothetical protein
MTYREAKMRATYPFALALLLLGLGAQPAGAFIKDEDYEADEKVAAEAEEACKADRGSTACQDLMERVADIVSRHLLQLSATGDGAAHMETVLPFARAGSPRIRANAAAAMGGLVPIAKETPTLIALLNDPVPAVRSAARAAMGASTDPAANRLAERAPQSDYDNFVANTPPDPASLGTPVYEGATYSFAISDPVEGVAAYASAAPRDDLLAFYEPKGVGGSLTLSEFEQNYSTLDDLDDNPAAAMQFQQQLMMQMMQQKKSGGKFDPMAMMSPPATELDTERYRGGDFYANPRIVVLEEMDLGSMKIAKRAVVIFADELQGGSGIVFHIPPPSGIPGMSGAGAGPSPSTPITPPPAEEAASTKEQSETAPSGMPSEDEMDAMQKNLQDQMQDQMQQLQQMMEQMQQQQQGGAQQ